jgi:hypothetical protein
MSQPGGIFHPALGYLQVNAALDAREHLRRMPCARREEGVAYPLAVHLPLITVHRSSVAILAEDGEAILFSPLDQSS